MCFSSSHVSLIFSVGAFSFYSIFHPAKLVRNPLLLLMHHMKTIFFLWWLLLEIRVPCTCCNLDNYFSQNRIQGDRMKKSGTRPLGPVASLEPVGEGALPWKKSPPAESSLIKVPELLGLARKMLPIWDTFTEFHIQECGAENTKLQLFILPPL